MFLFIKIRPFIFIRNIYKFIQLLLFYIISFYFIFYSVHLQNLQEFLYGHPFIDSFFGKHSSHCTFEYSFCTFIKSDIYF